MLLLLVATSEPSGKLRMAFDLLIVVVVISLKDSNIPASTPRDAGHGGGHGSFPAVGSLKVPI